MEAKRKVPRRGMAQRQCQVSDYSILLHRYCAIAYLGLYCISMWSISLMKCSFHFGTSKKLTSECETDTINVTWIKSSSCCKLCHQKYRYVMKVWMNMKEWGQYDITYYMWQSHSARMTPWNAEGCKWSQLYGTNRSFHQSWSQQQGTFLGRHSNT